MGTDKVTGFLIIETQDKIAEQISCIITTVKQVKLFQYLEREKSRDVTESYENQFKEVEIKTVRGLTVTKSTRINITK